MQKTKVIPLVLCLFLSSVSCSFATIENAFSEDLATMQKEYEEEYSWNSSLYYEREWNFTATGQKVTAAGMKVETETTTETIEMERKRGYQDYYLEDNLYSTLLTLGLTELELFEGIEYNPPKEAAAIARIAKKEINSYSKDKNGNNKAKYNFWLYDENLFAKMSDSVTASKDYDFNTTFVSWCINESGLLSYNSQIKTGNIYQLYANLKLENECKRFSDSLVAGGTYYIQTIGDVVFFANPERPTVLTAVGIVASASENSISIVLADMPDKKGSTGKVEKKTYKKGSVPKELLSGQSICLSKAVKGQALKGI